MTAVIENALKHQIAPLVQEMKKLQKEVVFHNLEIFNFLLIFLLQVLGSNKKITELKNQVALMAVTQKEIANNMDKVLNHLYKDPPPHFLIKYFI